MSTGAARRLESVTERFAVPLHGGEGINEPALDELKEVLAEVAAEWQHEETVPKDAAALLVELYPALIGNIDIYPEDQAERIQAVCEELLELSLACLAVQQ